MKVLSLLLAMTLAANATPADPGKAAIEFLEKVREGKINLEPGGDTAISPQTVETKRRVIAKRLERVARDLGKDPLEIGAVKMDENFAAVLIRKVGGFDTSRLQVFPVALVKKDDVWEAAPLPASFENSGAGYAISLRKRLEQLENWMLREQVVDLEKLREQSKDQLRSRIESKLSAAALGKFDVKETGERFVTACESGDLLSLLGVLGGLDSQLPDDWSTRLKASENAISEGPRALGPWRSMVAPDIARVLVHHETDGDVGLISIACLDPIPSGKAPRIELLHFALSRSTTGLWRIDPPPAFLQPSAIATAKQSDESEDEPAGENNNQEAVNRFPALWLAAHPAKPQPTAELAGQAWLGNLNGGGFAAFLANTRIDGDVPDSLKSCVKAALVWGSIRSGLAELALPIAFKADESSAVGIYQFLTTKDSEKLDARPIFFEKSSAGWLWTPEPSESSRDGLMPWVEDETRNLPETWQQTVLTGCPVIADVTGLESVSEDEARTCIANWLDALRRGNATEAISQMASLTSARSPAIALQNLAYEMAGSRGKPGSPPITGIYRANPWSMVGVKNIREDGKPAYPLYTVVKTAEGPRILAEIDLFASDKRGRDFLNNEALKRLGKATSEDAASEMRKLLDLHQAAIHENSKAK